MQIHVTTVLTEELEARWLEKWHAWPTAHLFNHPRWLEILKETRPGLKRFIICGRIGERDLVFVTAEEHDGGLQLAGTPYLDKGAILWDPEMTADAWLQFITLLLARYQWIRFQELCDEGPWRSMVIPSNSRSMLRHSSNSPYFDVSSPLLSSGQRKELRRCTNVLRRLGALDVTFRKFSYEDIDIMATIERQSTKVIRRIGILSNEECLRWFRALVSQMGAHCWIGLLTLDERPIAHYMAVLCKESLLGVHVAFLKQYATVSPGNVLIFNMLPQLCQQGIKRFDYGRGYNAAKAKFAGDISVSQYDLYYFRNSWKGLRARVRALLFWKLVALRRTLRKYAGRRINTALDRLAIRR